MKYRWLYSTFCAWGSELKWSEFYELAVYKHSSLYATSFRLLKNSSLEKGNDIAEYSEASIVKYPATLELYASINILI